MKWKRKRIKCVKFFALFPVCLNDEFRWLETVYVIKEYRWGSLGDGWYADRFVDKFVWEAFNEKS